MPKKNATSPIVTKVSSGKVRDLYDFSGLIFKTSNRLSVFDVVICENVHNKGAMLNCISQSNKEFLEKKGIKTDYLGKIPSEFFSAAGFQTPELGSLSYNKKLNMIPAEIIVRHVLTGSLWKAYQNGEAYCGIILPDGLKEGDLLPYPIITPTTKASSGHDKPLSKDELLVVVVGWLLDNYTFEITEDVEDEFNRILNDLDEEETENSKYFDVEDVLFGAETVEEYWQQIEFSQAHFYARNVIEEIYSTSLRAFELLAKKCEEVNILFVDTKFEFGADEDGNIVLGDEVGTPDSSRFTSMEEYNKTGKLVSMDKQIVRDYCRDIGFKGDKGQKIPEIPDWIWQKVTTTYIDLAVQLCGPEKVKDHLKNSFVMK